MSTPTSWLSVKYQAQTCKNNTPAIPRHPPRKTYRTQPHP